MTEGPPVEKENAAVSETGVPASVFKPGFRVNRQAMPPGRFLSKS